jgi:hypothetical protein
MSQNLKIPQFVWFHAGVDTLSSGCGTQISETDSALSGFFTPHS